MTEFDQQRNAVEQQKAQRRKDLIEDCLYYGGAIAIAIGRGLPSRWAPAIETIGGFLVLPPLLALTSGFLRGLLMRPARQK